MDQPHDTASRHVARDGRAYVTEVVGWDDARGARIRRAMEDEMDVRYEGRHADDPDWPAKAAVAFALDPADVEAVVLLVPEGDDREAAAHGVIRRLDGELELKKVVVDPAHRGTGLARVLMAELERVARERGAPRLILQTGDRQPDAVRLYETAGWRQIDVYPPYLPVTNSICFEKPLR
jgi:GNAT superfamily N-acetyltransferase